MPKIAVQEFNRLPLRVHDFLAGVPLHDVWAVDLPRLRPGITLDAFLRRANMRLFTPSPVVSTLLKIRFLVGRLLAWDVISSEGRGYQTFADRLTTADRVLSLATAGLRDGPFRVVYRFENEQLGEIVNRTARVAALSALVEMASSYRFYFAVYVGNVSRLTPLYMALIDPFRRFIVYPSLLRSVRANWNRTIEAV